MDARGMLDRVVAAVHEATLRSTLWPQVSALIDETCGATGNAIVVSEGSGEKARIHFRAAYYRGERNEELEAYYFHNYHHRDERVPRLWQLPDGQLFHVQDFYTEQEKRTSPAYNEALPRTGDGNGLAVRLDGPDGARITWNFANPSRPGGWGARQTEMIEYLLPHVRQFVQFRQALAKAQALNSSLVRLLDNARAGFIQLDQRGRMMEVNDRALEILRRGDGLLDRGGALEARSPVDDTRLQALLAGALPALGGQAAAGTMTIRGSGGAPGIVLRINPVDSLGLDDDGRRVAALVLLSEPANSPRLDAGWVGEVLDLTAAESQTAVLFSQGMTVPAIAAATGRRPATIKTLIRRTYRKLGISRRAELLRVLWSLGEAPTSRP